LICCGWKPQPRDSFTTPERNLDWDKALGAVGGDRQLLAELAELFLQECPKWLATICAAIDAHEPAMLQKAAHTLKGGLTTFAAGKALKAAFRLEMLGRQGDLSSAPQALMALRQELERVQPALTALAKEMGGSAAKAEHAAGKGETTHGDGARASGQHAAVREPIAS
jgi:HPt (histidine-containing phosphotransfer) domain-containing protein